MTLDKLKALQKKKELFIYLQNANNNVDFLFDDKNNKVLKLIK